MVAALAGTAVTTVPTAPRAAVVATTVTAFVILRILFCLLSCALSRVVRAGRLGRGLSREGKGEDGPFSPDPGGSVERPVLVGQVHHAPVALEGHQYPTVVQHLQRLARLAAPAKDAVDLMKTVVVRVVPGDPAPVRDVSLAAVEAG